MIMRGDTQDYLVWASVFRDNEYKLPDKFNDGDVIVDVGAHIGMFALACLERGAGKVVCFEPEKNNFRILAANLKPYGDRAECHQLAVWKSGGDEQVYLTVNTEGYTAMNHCMLYTGIPVVSIQFDAIILQFPKVRLVKLDCEGAEGPILHTTKTLDRVQEICGEAHYGLMPLDVKPGEVDGLLHTWLEKWGFSVEIVLDKDKPELISNFWGRRQ